MLRLGASESNRDTSLAWIINTHCFQDPHGDSRKGGLTAEAALRNPPFPEKIQPPKSSQYSGKGARCRAMRGL